MNEVCPEGMYPPGTEEVTFVNYAIDFEELKDMVEPTLGSLNFPLGWSFDDEYFEIVIWMPRKMKTWSVRVEHYDRNAVQQWLDIIIKENVMEWYGWN